MTVIRRGGAAPALRTSILLRAAAAAGAIAWAGAAQAAGTPAGTQIQNVATATYELPSGDEVSVDSNMVSLTVDELLDVAVAWSDPADVAVAPGQSGRVLAFTLTNAGNGSEAFALQAIANLGGDDFDPTVTSIAIDANNNGVYDPGVDTVYVAGANDPVLAADESIAIFVISSIPAGGQDLQRGRVDLRATAVTGSGAPGTSFAGQGQGGGNAVVGATGGAAQDDGHYRISAADIAFVKSASVADPWGGTTQGPGSVITYTLTATVSGSGSLANLKVSDAIPAGTSYEPGSITLDGNPLTDAADADAGRFTGTGIEVGLGNAAAGPPRTITFRVKID